MATATLNDSQVLILRALAKTKNGYTVEELKAKVPAGVAVNAGNIGPAFKDLLGNYPESLYALGMVRAAKTPEDDATRFAITAAGAKAAKSYVCREQPTIVADIPTAALDRAVKAVKANRTYGLELFTPVDLAEIRTALNGSAKDVTDEDLRLRICNRRKQGAYTNPEEKAGRAAKAALNAFGPQGAIKKNLLDAKTVAALEKLIG